MTTAGAVSEKSMSESEDLRRCFDEWLSGLKAKIEALAVSQRDVEQIAASLGISKKVLLPVVIAMAREGSIRITGIRPSDQQVKRRKGQ